LRRFVMAIEVRLPTDENFIRSLKVGDEVLITGTLVTARDMAHKYMVEKRPEFLKDILRGTAIYHCGPVVRKEQSGEYRIIAAGPTTSSREEPYQASVIEQYKIVGVIGKGGMGDKTSEALKKFGAVYFHAVGGAGSLLAKCVKKVKDVLMLEEFGSPEAFWVLEVENFPAVVTMDAHGGSLHRQVLKESEARLKEILESFGTR
jgi:fumarate hydratase class I